MSAWRAALRISAREAKRAKARSALIITMIALPVMALSFAVVTYDTFDVSNDEQAAREMGTAEATLMWRSDAPVPRSTSHFHNYAIPDGARENAHTDDEVRARLPEGTRILRDQQGTLVVQTAGGIGTIGTRALDYSDPMAHGLLRPVDGRAPASDDEVALTEAAVSRLGSGIGGTVRLADGSRTLRVTGIVENSGNLSAATMITRSAPLSPDAIWLVDKPPTADQIAVLNSAGISVVTRQMYTHPAEVTGSGRAASGIAVGVLIGGVAILQVVLLAGAALAVGARRRSRDMALVAAVGGAPHHVRRIVLADGLLHGVIAAVLGAVLGIGAAAASIPLLENEIFNKRAEQLRVWPAALAAIAGFAVLAGVLAAVVPAWSSSRQDVVATLTGRRGIVRTRRRWPVVGLVTAVLGAGVCVGGVLLTDLMIVLLGLLVGTAGLVLCIPAAIGLVAGFGRWLPVSARIALRDTARNRTAAAPAISAVMAAVIGTLAIGVVTGSQTAYGQSLSSMRAGDVFLANHKESIDAGAVATMRSVLPVDQVHEVGRLRTVWAKSHCPYGSTELVSGDDQRSALADPRCSHAKGRANYFGVVSSLGNGVSMIAVIEPEAVEAVTGIPGGDAPAASAALRAGRVVVDDPGLVSDDRVTLVTGELGEQQVTAPAFVTPIPGRVPLVLLTRQTATSLGFHTEPLGVLATTTRMPTVEENDRLSAALPERTSHYIEWGAQNSNTTMTLLAIAAGVITLGASAIATGLAAADRQAEVTTLAAIGASPGVRRKLALSQSGLIAGMGSVLGAIVGVGAAVAVLSAYNQSLAGTWPAPVAYPIVVPWANVAIAVLAVPVIAMLGTGLFTRSRLPIERRQ